MRTWTIARALLGVALILLGGLWALQGADLVRIGPILCVADCQPITGGSTMWLTIGIVTLLIGLGLTAPRLRPTRRRRPTPDA
jgi:hypothetical protein